jgi:hypothetical protein
LRIDRKGVVVQIADLERGDLGAPPADLQTDREDRAVAQAGDDVLRRCVQNLRVCNFEKRTSSLRCRRPPADHRGRRCSVSRM